MIRKAATTKAAFLKTAYAAAMKLFKKHPLPSTGAAAAAGFIIAGKWSLRAEDEGPTGATLSSLILATGLDILKEVAPPLILEHFQDHSSWRGSQKSITIEGIEAKKPRMKSQV